MNEPKGRPTFVGRLVAVGWLILLIALWIDMFFGSRERAASAIIVAAIGWTGSRIIVEGLDAIMGKRS